MLVVQKDPGTNNDKPETGSSAPIVEEEDDENIEDEEVTITTITATAGYAGPEWTVEDDWVSIKFEFSEVPSNMQLKFTGDVVKSVQNWGTEYDAAYSGLIEDTSIEKTINDMIPFMELNSTKVTKVSIVDMGQANGVAKITRVSVTKSDGTTQELTIPDPSWGYTKN